MYENDPNAEVFRRFGVGQLTHIGKARAYKIGRVLRKRYDNFLGEYKAGEVSAYSTNKDRTKMSLNLLLAGLYPPSCRTKWNDKILWSPVPISYNATVEDMLTWYTVCPRYFSLLFNASDTIENRAYLQQYRDVTDYGSEMTGFNLSNILQVGFLDNNLRSGKSLNLPLLHWCTRHMYEVFHKIAKFTLGLMTSTKELAMITIGPIIEKFLHNIHAQDNNKAETKIYLYSGHDVNLAPFINFHNFSRAPDYPAFGSAIVVEKLRGPDGQVYLRMFMWTGVSKKWLRLKFRNCSRECPLSDYLNLVKWVFPDDESKACYLSELGYTN